MSTAAPHATQVTRDEVARRIAFADAALAVAEHCEKLNTIHSFREGNTRAQFVSFTQLAEHAGYTLDPAPFAPGQPLRDEFVWARFHNQATGRTDRLAALLDQAITPTEHTARIHREALRPTQATNFPHHSAPRAVSPRLSPGTTTCPFPLPSTSD